MDVAIMLVRVLLVVCMPLLVGPILMLLISEAFCQLKVVTLKSSLKFMEWSDIGAFAGGYFLCMLVNLATVESKSQTGLVESSGLDFTVLSISVQLS